MATSDTLRGSGVFLRFLFAVLIVFATFNPWGASFYHWALAPLFGAGGGIGTLGPLKVLAGLVLIVGWVICIQSTKRSLGIKGALLVVAIFATVIWLLIDQRLLSATGSRAIATIVLILVSIVLAIGMSWSHLNRRLTGQVDTDQVA